MFITRYPTREKRKRRKQAQRDRTTSEAGAQQVRTTQEKTNREVLLWRHDRDRKKQRCLLGGGSLLLLGCLGLDLLGNIVSEDASSSAAEGVGRMRGRRDHVSLDVAPWRDWGRRRATMMGESDKTAAASLTFSAFLVAPSTFFSVFFTAVLT